MNMRLPLHPTMTDPRTGTRLRAIFIDSNGRARWPIMGADEPSEADKAAAAAAEAKQAEAAAAAAKDVPAGYAVGEDGKSLGFPKETPVAEMKPEQQAAYFRHQNGKQQQRAEGWQKVAGDRTPEQVAADLKELEDLRTKNMTAGEKAIAEAVEQGRAEARTTLAPEMARLAFNGHFSHLPEERATVILDGIDFSKFYDSSTGKVDTAKVATHAEALAPKSGKDTRDADYGNGARHTKSGGGGVQAVIEARRQERADRAAGRKS